MSAESIRAYEKEIIELEEILEACMANPQYGNTISMARWGRQTASVYGAEQELEFARNQLRALDSSNQLADESRTERIKAKHIPSKFPVTTSRRIQLKDNPYLLWAICLPAMYFLSYFVCNGLNTELFGTDTTTNYIIQGVLVLGLPAVIYFVTGGVGGDKIGLVVFLVPWNLYSFFVHVMNSLTPMVESYWPVGFLEPYHRAPVYLLCFCGLIILLVLANQLIKNRKTVATINKIGNLLIGATGILLTLLVARHFSPSDPLLDPLLSFIGMM